jgi:predicted nucleic acid-binding protein
VIAYLDSSVILRLVLNEPKPLREWAEVHQAVTSALAEVEVFRTFDRLRFSASTIDPLALAARREVAFRILRGARDYRDHAWRARPGSSAAPHPLGTLDAIHLVSAMGWLEQFESPAFATHDPALAAAARASGFEVIGASQG